MTEFEEKVPTAEQKAREILESHSLALAEAAASVEPDDRRSLLEIFPEPGERRADTEFTLPPDREADFRQAMAKLGIGRETNRGASEVGLRGGYVAAIEGGQAHKMAAELKLVLADSTTVPSKIIVAATPERPIPEPETDKAKEKEITAKVLDIDIDKVGANEYEVAKQAVSSISGFYASGDKSYSFRYDMEGNVSAGIDSGQFTQIGFIEGIPVVMLRVDREYSEVGKYKTLGTRGILKVVDGFLRLVGTQEVEIGLATSSTYQPSREVDAASTMLELQREGSVRNIGVITYGTHELAQVKKEDLPRPPELGQLAGEAHKAAKQVESLRNLVDQKSSEAE